MTRAKKSQENETAQPETLPPAESTPIAQPAATAAPSRSCRVRVIGTSFYGEAPRGAVIEISRAEFERIRSTDKRERADLAWSQGTNLGTPHPAMLDTFRLEPDDTPITSPQERLVLMEQQSSVGAGVATPNGHMRPPTVDEIVKRALFVIGRAKP